MADVPCDAPAITFAKSDVTISPTRDHHVTFVREVGGTPYLYVIGGEDENFDVLHDDVQRARVREDGTLEPFEAAGKLPTGRAGAALAVVGDTVVLAGGVVPTPTFTDEILVGRFDAGGRLDTWSRGPKLPAKVQHAAAVVIDRDVFVFGGTKGSAASNISVKTTVQEDGTLSPLVSLTPLDPVRSHHVAFVDGDSVYLVGGLDKSPLGNPPSRKDVVRARVQADHTLSAWEKAGAISSPLSISAVERVGCSLLFVGGLDDTVVKDGPYSNHILRASLGGDGALRSESPLATSLNVSRGHVHQTPRHGRFVYSVGGRGNDDVTLGVVEIGTIAQ